MIRKSALLIDSGLLASQSPSCWKTNTGGSPTEYSCCHLLCNDNTVYTINTRRTTAAVSGDFCNVGTTEVNWNYANWESRHCCMCWTGSELSWGRGKTRVMNVKKSMMNLYCRPPVKLLTMAIEWRTGLSCLWTLLSIVRLSTHLRSSLQLPVNKCMSPHHLPTRIP